jgi:hypothetical protein
MPLSFKNGPGEMAKSEAEMSGFLKKPKAKTESKIE